MRTLILLAVFFLCFGCSNNEQKEDLNSIKLRLTMIEERLSQVEKIEQKAVSLESQLKALQESVERLDGLVAAKSEEPSAPEKPATSKTEARYHVVRTGDTLFQIAQEYGMSVEEILRINNLTKAQAIYPGQKLLLTPKSPQ